MTYPLISEYVAAILNAADNLDKLSGLNPVMDTHGEPVHSSGAFAVVFKMFDVNGKYFALKCFTEEQTGRDEAYRLIADELDGIESKYLTSVRYYEKELFVDSNVSDETEFPVLLMDWIEGETMDVYIADNYHDNSAMEWLCYRFCKMASWLRSQPFAHGDIKPDNIIVGEDRELTLIDYDGMFVPAMKGWKSPTLGTKDFVHPNRKIEDFDETIDDFTLASIALSLKAISLDSSLYDKFGAADRLLFSSDDYLNLGKSETIAAIQPLMSNIDLMQLDSLFKHALAAGNLSSVSFRTFIIRKPEKTQECQLTAEEIAELCKVTDEELNSVDWDETGAKYSKDGKRLLKVRKETDGEFIIRRGTIVIGSNAFKGCCSLTSISLPSSITYIGDFAFRRCSRITSITIPSNVKMIMKGAFDKCMQLESINVHPENICYSSYNNCNAIIDKKTCCLIAGCKNTIIPSSVKSIGEMAFSGCSSLSSITIPSGVTSIGKFAFLNCSSLTSINIPSSVTMINDGAFASCRQLELLNVHPENIRYSSYNNCNAIIDKVTGCLIAGCMNTIIPFSVTSIGDWAFSGYSSLSSITIPSSVTSIGKCAFCLCSSLTSITIPSSVTSIGVRAFSCCSSLTSINIPSSVTSIGKNAFENCYNLISITIPSSVTSIGEGAFCKCSNLTSITIPSSVTSIGKRIFSSCSKMKRIDVHPDDNRYSSYKNCNAIIDKKTNCLIAGCKNTIIPFGVTSIGDGAFWGCEGLTSITIPSSVTSIGMEAFSFCSSLASIVIPSSVTSIGESAFYWCGLESINIPSSVMRIGDNAFENCGIKSINIPFGVTNIGNFAFNSCCFLRSITIPSSIINIGDGVFSDCFELTSIYIPLKSKQRFMKMLPDYQYLLVESPEVK